MASTTPDAAAPHAAPPARGRGSRWQMLALILLYAIIGGGSVWFLWDAVEHRDHTEDLLYTFLQYGLFPLYAVRTGLDWLHQQIRWPPILMALPIWLILLGLGLRLVREDRRRVVLVWAALVTFGLAVNLENTMRPPTGRQGRHVGGELPQ